MSFINSFKENGYFEYPIFDLYKPIQKLANYWQVFCDQPYFEKNKFYFSEESGGYEYQGEESLDFKETFHFSLNNNFSFNDKSSASVALLKNSEDFLTSFQFLVKDIIEIIDKASGTNMASMLDLERFILRFNTYFPTIGTQREKSLLAAPHIDKGITIHLYEDCSGFEILWKGQWSKVIHRQKFLIGYFGMLGQFYSKGNFPALCHRVSPHMKSIQHGRRAIVLFIDFGDYIYDKEKWGSTQKVFPNGENYGMPFEEFLQYFKNR
jgi:hypothetical protein